MPETFPWPTLWHNLANPLRGETHEMSPLPIARAEGREENDFGVVAIDPVDVLPFHAMGFTSFAEVQS